MLFYHWGWRFVGVENSFCKVIRVSWSHLRGSWEQHHLLCQPCRWWRRSSSSTDASLVVPVVRCSNAVLVSWGQEFSKLKRHQIVNIDFIFTLVKSVTISSWLCHADTSKGWTSPYRRLSVSAPTLPVSRSAPAPPESVSSPTPPWRRSLPPAPVSVSLPPPP